MTDPRPRRPYLGYFLVLVGVLLNLSPPLDIGSDGQVRYDTLGKYLKDGKLDSVRYSLAGPLCSVPLWHIGEAIGHKKDAVVAFNRIVFVLTVGGFWFALRPVLGERERLRFVLFLLFGSLFSWHVRGYFGELFHAAAVGLGLAVAAVRPGRWGWFAWPAVVWGTANAPAAVPGLGLAIALLCWHRRRLRYGLVVVAAVGVIFLENYLRRGDPMNAGYKNDKGFQTALPYSGLPDFSYPLFFGLLSILFSFGKGLVFYTPGLFLKYPPAADDDREAKLRLVYRMWVAVVVGLVLVYARWWAWYGGGVWGPRFFLFASLPAALVLARITAHPTGRSLWMNVVALVAVCLSCWAAANGMVFDIAGFDVFWDNYFALEHLLWYVPECSALWRPFVAPYELGWRNKTRLVVFGIGMLYLAAPLVWAIGGQLREKARELWREFRDGPRFKV